MIKDYIKTGNQEDWINYIIEALQGTCNNANELEDEYVAEGFDLSSLHDGLDNSIFLCDSCGWWCEAGDYGEEDNTCSECDD